MTKQHIVTVAARVVKRRGLSAFSMRGLARQLRCQPAALYPHVRSKEHLLAAVAEVAERKLIAAMFPAPTGRGDKPAQEAVSQAIEALLQFASDDPHSWELLFLHPTNASGGRRTRVTLEGRLASLVAECGAMTDDNSASAAGLAKLAMTVAIGEAAIRVCRPGLIGCQPSAGQIVGLFLQPPQDR